MFPLNEENGFELQNCTDLVIGTVNSDPNGLESVS